MSQKLYAVRQTLIPRLTLPKDKEETAQGKRCGRIRKLTFCQKQTASFSRFSNEAHPRPKKREFHGITRTLEAQHVKGKRLSLFRDFLTKKGVKRRFVSEKRLCRKRKTTRRVRQIDASRYLTRRVMSFRSPQSGKKRASRLLFAPRKGAFHK